MHEAATQRTSTLASLPFASAFALRTTLLQPLFLGQEVRVLPSPYYDVEALANAVAGNKIQHLYAVPDLISELLSSPSTIRFDLTCVKSITCTSSELRPAVERGLYTLFKVALDFFCLTTGRGYHIERHTCHTLDVCTPPLFRKPLALLSGAGGGRRRLFSQLPQPSPS